jgi:hypothetical protein
LASSTGLVFWFKSDLDGTDSLIVFWGFCFDDGNFHQLGALLFFSIRSEDEDEAD